MRVSSLRCTTDMYKYLYDKVQEIGLSDILIVKGDDKPSAYKGKYIAINCLPFTFDKALTTIRAMNINLHCPKLKNGTADKPALEQMLEFISGIIPLESAVEDTEELMLNDVYYSIHSQTNPMEDKDGTYFVNVRLSLTFNIL